MRDSEVIKVSNINLIYKTAESLSVKKAFKMLFHKGESSLLNKYKALSNVSCTLERGKVYGIIGNNGAGKSTLLRVLSGVMSPNSGKVERNYKTINLLALGAGFSKELTGYDNIFLNGMILGFTKKQIQDVIDQIIEYSEIGDFIYKPMKTYSSGMVSRLGFSIAVHLKPEVLLIDEVLSVGDIKFRKKSFESIKQIIKDEDITVAIVSHGMEQIESLCDCAIWLDKGRLVAQGDVSDVLELYSDFNNGKITIDEIINKNSEHIELNEATLNVDCTDYSVKILDASEKKFLDKTFDYVKEISNKNTNIKLTRRVLPSKDILLYFQFDNTSKMQVEIKLDEVLEKEGYQELYKKPEYDNRYGENKISGLDSYLDLKQGSAVLSKVYYYKQLEKVYDENSSSNVFELKKEEDTICLQDNKIKISIEQGYEKCSFFILLSREKLFKDKNNLKEYMEYFYENLANNNVWCSYFMLPSGTYTKLPYSIEPFTKDGYGFSFHHSSRKDLFPFFVKTRERFYEDIIDNAILQVYMYQKNINGVFFTPYTSTWLKKDTNIVAPYIDTRLNETFIHMLQDYLPHSYFNERIEPLKNYVEFLIDYYEKGNGIYRVDEAVFFPDYFKEGLEKITHSSLNHQLGTASLLLEAYLKFKDERYISLYWKIIDFVNCTSSNWVNLENSDLYYGINYTPEGKLNYYGTDYVYVTLIDLMLTQIAICEFDKSRRSEGIDYLIEAKIKYLKSTEYDPFSDTSKIAPGETVDSKYRIRNLLKKLNEL